MLRNVSETRPKSDERLCLGSLRFDLGKGELQDADDNVVNLRNQSADVLAALAARPMQTIRKEDLISTIWSDVAVTDDSLAQCIGDIRRAVGPDGRHCIQTVRRRSYRLVPADPEPKGEAVVSMSGRRKRRSTAISVVIAALIVLGVAFYAALRMFGTTETAVRTDKPFIVVLPFANTNAYPGQEHFIDGLTEDITTDLSRVSGLIMISSATSLALRDTESKLDELARELGADFI